jgi:transcriptional regulator with XRE-family HTH domain/Zn-dependent peptidase ImmA (M78 family)
MALHERLRQTREKLGLTLQQVADRVGLSPPTISAYETGQREPSFSHLTKFAKLYCRPIEYFFSEEAEPEEVVLWRTKPYSPTAQKLEAKLLELGQHYRTLEVWSDCVMPPRLPSYEADRDDAAVMAASVRKSLGLGDRPGASLAETLQEAGVKIFHLPIEPKPAAAATVTAAFGPAVLLNSSADRQERTYSLAHELFHLLAWGQYGQDSAEGDALANRFADCLLLPEDAVRQVVTFHQRHGKLTVRELDLIARGFDVPLEALIRRLGDVFPLPKERIRQILLQVQAAGFSGKADWSQTPSSRPRRFIELATKAYEEGKLSLGRLAEYLGINRQEAMKRYFHDGEETILDEEVLINPNPINQSYNQLFGAGDEEVLLAPA